MKLPVEFKVVEESEFYVRVQGPAINSLETLKTYDFVAEQGFIVINHITTNSDTAHITLVKMFKFETGSKR